ncbi:MAG: HEAT repeat domain-containing protein [Aggregatilineales bacterium]
MNLLKQWIDALGSPSLIERITADVALMNAGAAAVEPLLACLNDLSRPLEMRWRAAVNLGSIGDSRSLEALIAALNDEAWEVRHSAAWALGRLADQRGFAALVTFVEHPSVDEQIPYVIAMALIDIDQAAAQQVLQHALSSPHEDVRSWAHSALLNLDFVAV